MEKMGERKVLNLFELPDGKSRIVRSLWYYQAWSKG